MSASNSSSNNIWFDIDPQFYKIKQDEDILRKLYSLNRDDSARPDKKNTLHDLVKLDDDMLIDIRKNMISAHANNCANNDIQTRSYLNKNASPCQMMLNYKSYSVGHDYLKLIRKHIDMPCNSSNFTKWGVKPMDTGRSYCNFLKDGLSKDESINVKFNNITVGTINKVKYTGFSIINSLPKSIKQNICIAGGYVLDYIRVAAKANDVDLFIVGTDEPAKIAEKLISYLFTYDCEPNKTNKIHVVRTKNSITLYSWLDKYRNPIQLQIILRSYTSVSEVVTGFDLDPSGVCFYMGNLYATKRAIYSLKNMKLYVDIDRMSTSYNYRLVKYMKIKGFSIVIPVPITKEIMNQVLIHTSRDVCYTNSYLQRNFNDSLIGLLVIERLVIKHHRGLMCIKVSDYDEHKSDCEHKQKSDCEQKSDSKSDSKSDDLIDCENGIPKKTSGKFCVKDIIKNDIIKNNCPESYSYIISDKDIIKYNYPRSYSYIISANKQITGVKFYINDINDIKIVMSDYLLSTIENKYKALDTTVKFITQNPGTQFTGSFHPIIMSWKNWERIIPGPKEEHILEYRKYSEPIRKQLYIIDYIWNN